MSEITFEAEFKRRLNGIKQRAKAAGTSMTALCKETGVARATPDRWSARAPKTITLIDQLEKALDRIEAEPSAASK